MPRVFLVVYAGLMFTAGCSTRYREVSIDEAQTSSRGGAAGHEKHLPSLRVSVASIESPRDTYTDWSNVVKVIGQRLDMEVSFVQRRTYEEVNELIEKGDLDVAFLCTGGYLELARRAPDSMALVAAPIYVNGRSYESWIIVPQASPASRLTDLLGKRFAFTDALSLTGRAYVVYLLGETGTTPERFFGSTIETYGHDRSIRAVARGLVDGAAVHSIIYQQLVAADPSLASSTRVIQRSPPFGTPPVVASTRLSPALRARLHGLFLGLADDPSGAAALQAVGIERFVDPPPGAYDTTARILKAR